MIIDHISRSRDYDGMHPGIDAGLQFLREKGLEDLELGRHEVGEGVFALVQEYTTKEPADGLWEGHRKFIDIQFLRSGSERIGYADRERLDTGAYDEDKDFLPAEGEGVTLALQPGDFMVLFPQDMHMPGMACGERREVRKIVVKVPV